MWMMIVLGLESSCDETAVGIVEIDDAQRCTLLANEVATSLDLHTLYGGVVPEIAARSHIESVIGVVETALQRAFGTEVDLGSGSLDLKRATGEAASKIQAPSSESQFDPWDRIDAIAVTYGAGLGGSLLVGVMTARTLAIVKNKPLYAINHVEAHVYANFITGVKDLGSESLDLKRDTGEAASKLQDPSSKPQTLHGKDYTLPSSAPQFPMLAVIVSGGHSQLALFQDHFRYTLLGKTRDDAIGEAFDKVAKITGLPYPGGPSVAQAALLGDSHKYKLPKPKLSGDASSRYDFSFSGLKTAVLRLAQAEIGKDFTFPSFKIAEQLSEQQRNDIAASFQRVATEIIADKVLQAYKEFHPRSIVLAGGVAASGELRHQLTQRLHDLGSEGLDLEGAAATQSSKLQDLRSILQYPDIKLCTDNGAMVATLGCFKALLGQPTADPYSLEIAPNLTM